jgi:uncharacterized protein
MPTPRTRMLPLAGNAPDWPDRSLDLAGLRAAGWRPTPFRDVVLKVHQRCNLACDYCYVYTMADQGWRDRPTIMVRDVWQATATRMVEHAATHELREMRVVLHGGEPLLAGRSRLAELISDFRSAFARSPCRLNIQMQTNGVLLDAPMLELLRDHEVRVGVSLDGTPEQNDRRRRRVDGRGSHADVDRALRALTSPRYHQIFAGLLCTVDPTIDPIACYEALLAYAPPAIDLLLPHANWSSPPGRPAGGEAPHADWLIAVFDRWYDAPRQETGIRLFEDLLALTLGGTSRSEQVGLSPVAVLVVESDGTLEQVDSLKSAYPGACHTGLSVADDPFDAALENAGVVARQIGVRALGETCLVCPVHEICGGGHYAHRYRAGTGFRNPSVYCADMLRLIRHVTGRVSADLARVTAGGPA